MAQEFKALTWVQESVAQALVAKVLVVQVILAQVVLLAQVRLVRALMAELEFRHPTSEELLESMHQALVELLESMHQTLEESQALTSLTLVALASTALDME